MSSENVKLIRRIIAQTDSVTITAQTKREVTEDQAIDDTLKHVLSAVNGYRKFIVLPVCTEEQWTGGNVNFCPRCGHRLSEWDTESVESEYFSECPECYADLDVTIRVHGGDSE